MSWLLRLGLLSGIAAALAPAGGAGGTTMKTPIMSHAASGTALSNSATRFLAFCGGGNASILSSSATQARTPVAIPGSIANLEVNFPTAVVTGSYAITLQVNGVDSALTLTISSGNRASDTTHSVSVVAGDDVCWKIVPTSTPTAQATPISVACVFTATNAGESIIFGASGSATVTTSTFMQPGASFTAADDASASGIIAAPGVIDHLYVRTSAAPGGIAAWTFTANQNETPSLLTCIVTSAISTTSDLVDAITVVAGDRLSMASIATGTPAAATLLWSVRWVPTTNGQSLLFMTANATLPANSADRFLPLAGQGNNASVETVVNIAPLACTIQNMYIRQLPQITGGTSRAITLRAGAASQSLTVTFTNGGATDDHDTTHSYSASVGDLLDLLVHPVGSPTALTTLKVGAVAYIPPS